MGEPPSAEVVRSFGGDPSAVEPLDGGEGTSWRAGGVVLKPAGQEEEVAWVAAFVESLDLKARVRVGMFVRTRDGEFVREGWAANEWLEGQHREDRWEETLAAAKAFHEAARVSSREWPSFMSERSDPWSRATRAAWGEESLPLLPSAAAEVVEAALQLLPDGATSSPFQVIHSDLAGNVLFDDDLDVPPAIIDISPQFRSAEYAEGILVADAVAWSGADVSLAHRFLDGSPSRRADIARAIVFRITTAALFPNATAARIAAEAGAYRRLMPLLV